MHDSPCIVTLKRHITPKDGEEAVKDEEEMNIKSAYRLVSDIEYILIVKSSVTSYSFDFISQKYRIVPNSH